MKRCLAGLAMLFCATNGFAAETESWKSGDLQLQSISSIAFAPEGVLLVGDSMGAAVYAVRTREKAADQVPPVQHGDVTGAAAKLLDAEAGDVRILDMAISPAGSVFLAVQRGSGPESTPLVLRLADGKLTEFDLHQVDYMKAQLPNAPESKPGRRNPRTTAITDLMYLDGKVYVAGLSNEEFASNLRSIAYPFTEFDQGASVEIFHGAHGRLETNSPVRTFAAFEIDGEPHLLAAYTCTPLVKIPVSSLKAGKHVKGVTIAELGNRNRPLDMVVYSKGGKRFVLMANSSRGVMKIRTDGIQAVEAITERVTRGGTAGLPYDTVGELKGVEQLDRLDEDRAVVLLVDGGVASLKTIDLP